MRPRMPDARMCVYAIVGAAALVALVVGVFSNTVMATMDRRVESARRIEALARKPRNADCVEARRRNVATVEREFDAVQRYLGGEHRRRPLIDGVLPVPRSDAERYAFAEAYAAAFVSLAKRLGGGPAGATEVDIAQREVHELRAWLAEQDGGEVAKKQIGRPRVAGESSHVRTGRLNSKGGDPRFDAELRANVDRAGAILCYAEPSSFHISPVIREFPPSMIEIWYAQVGLWIQQDLVAAIATLNGEAAALAGNAAKVQCAPIKRVIQIQIEGYCVDAETVRFDSIDGRRPHKLQPARQGLALHTGGDDVDVVHFRVTLVVDQRDLLQVIDGVLARGLYRCVGLRIGTANDERTAGYFYGSEPVVCVQLECEAYFLRAIVEPLMPPETLQELAGRNQGGGGG